MMHYGFGFGWIGAILGFLLFVGLLVLLVTLIVLAIRRVGKPNHMPGFHGMGMAQHSAKEIAQMRYAKGEISYEEYQKILSDLS